jgi:hypothetical protein
MGVKHQRETVGKRLIQLAFLIGLSLGDFQQ